MDFIEWIIQIPKHELEYYNEQVDLIEQEDKTMGYMSIFRREAYAQGIEQGQQKGIGRALKAQLKLKFGDIADHWQHRLDNATNEQLDLWTERILFADSIEELMEDS